MRSAMAWIGTMWAVAATPWAALATQAGLAAQVATASPSGYREFKDWVAGCDQTAHCTAIGLAAEEADARAMLHFERGPSPTDAVTHITLWVDETVPEDAVGWWLLADGAPLLPLDLRHWVETDVGDGADARFTDPGEIRTLLGVLRTAHTLTLQSPQGAAGSVSLAGAKAALLWIDERQQRLDTPGAFVRTGTRIATAPFALPAEAPPPPTAWQVMDGPRTTALVAEARLALHPEGCDAIEDLLRTPDDQAWIGADGVQLVQVECHAGAYNFSSRWMLRGAPGTPLHVLSFSAPTTFDSSDPGPWTEWVNAEFDPASGRVDAHAKGRGIGDCGQASEWAYVDRSFRLLSYRMMGVCRGVWGDRWPLLWRMASHSHSHSH